MKTITLTQGQIALVDDQDFEELSKYKWFAIKSVSGYTFYAGRKDHNHKTVLMHHHILGSTIQTDHKNSIGTDNQRHNLRQCTSHQNQGNQILRMGGTSKYKGVHRAKNRWCAQISVNGRRTYIGIFKSEEDAAVAYNNKAKELFGSFARLNEV